MSERVAALTLLSAFLFCGFMAMIGMNLWLWRRLMSWQRQAVKQRLDYWVGGTESGKGA